MKHSQGLLPCPPFYSLNGGYGSQGSKELPFVLLSPLGLCLLDFQKELWESLGGGGRMLLTEHSVILMWERKDPRLAVFLGLTRHDEGLSGKVAGICLSGDF